MDDKARITQGWASGYMSTLTPALLQELGKINLDWFDDMTEEHNFGNDITEKQKLPIACSNENSKVTTTEGCGSQRTTEAVGIEPSQCKFKRISSIRSQPYTTSSPRVSQVAEGQSRNVSTPRISDIKSPSTAGMAGNTPASLANAIRRIDRHSTPNYGQEQNSDTGIKSDHNHQGGKMGKPQQLSTPVFSPWLLKNDDRTSRTQYDHSEDLDQLLDRVLDSESQNNVNTYPLQQSITDSETLTATCESVASTSEHTQPPAVVPKGLSKLLMLKTPMSLVSKSGKEKDLQRMLGVNPNESGMSWTSSLATPTSYDAHQVLGSGLNGKEQEFTVGAARKLFSPGTNFSDMEETALDTTAEEDLPLQSPVFKSNNKEAKGEAESSPYTIAGEVPQTGPYTIAGEVPQTGPYTTGAGEILNSNINTANDHTLDNPPTQRLDYAAPQGTHSEDVAEHKLTGVSCEDVCESKDRYKRTNGTPEQSVSLNVLGDLFDTPPSRSSLRKPPPKKRMPRKRHIAPCAIESKLSEDSLMSKPCEHVLQLSPVGGTVDNLSMGVGAGLSDRHLNGSTACVIASNGQVILNDTAKTDSEPNISHSMPVQKSHSDSNEAEELRSKAINYVSNGESIQKNEEKIPEKVNNDDMFFTQISQTALNAIYMEVDETEKYVRSSISNQKDQQESTEPKLKEITNVQVKTETEDKMCKSIEGHLLHKQGTADDLFTQMSPRALKSILSETDHIEKLSESSLLVPQSSECKSKCVIDNQESTSNQRHIETPIASTGSKERIGSPSSAEPGPTVASRQAPSAKLVGYSRKAKRFSYPTTKQISNVCPKKIFAFQPETHRDTSLKEHMSTVGSGDHLREIADDIKVGTTSSLPSTVRPETKAVYSRRKHDFGFTPLSACKENVQTVTPASSSSTNKTQQAAQVQTELNNEKLKPPCTRPQGPESSNASEIIWNKPVLTGKSVKALLSSIDMDNHIKGPTNVAELKIHIEKGKENSIGPLNERNSNALTPAVTDYNSNVEPKQDQTSKNRRQDVFANSKDTNVLSHKSTDIRADDRMSVKSNIPHEDKKLNDQNSIVPGYLVHSRDDEIEGGKEETLDPVKRYELEKWFAEDMDQEALTQYRTKQNTLDRSVIKEKEMHSKEEEPSTERSKVRVDGGTVESIGFKTASGQTIAVSAKDVARYASWLEEDCSEHEVTTKVPSKAVPTIPDVKTSGGKEIDVSLAGSEKHAVWFEEATIKQTLKNGDTSEAVLPICSFQTAGTEKIEDSTKHTARYETLLEEDPSKQKETMKSETGNTCESPGFQTAGGKEIKVSIKYAKDYANWFEDPSKQQVKKENLNETPLTTTQIKVSDEKEECSAEARVNSKGQSDIPATTSGFHTAGGKKIIVSTKEAVKFASWLEEDLSESKMDNEVTSESATMGAGFKTAGGKKINNSTKDTANYASWFEEQLSESKINKKVPSESQPMVASFKTAGGKKIEVPTNTAKYTSWLEEDASEMKTNKKVPSVSSPMTAGFKTAGGKTIDISTKDAAKYASWFEEDSPESKIYKKARGESPPMGGGFQTAGGKKIEVPIKDIAKYTNWLEEEAEHKTNKIPSAGLGFQTAGGKQIDYSTKDNEKFASWFEEGTSKTLMKEGPSKAILAHSTESKGPSVYRTAANTSSGSSSSSGEKSSKLKQVDDQMIDDPFDAFIKGLKKVAATKQEKDYSKLPKGFRPFKRPRMIGKPQDKGLSKKEVPDPKAHTEPAISTESDLDKLKQTDQPSKIKAEEIQQVFNSCKEPEDANMGSLEDSFDNLPYTQITEMTDCAAAFLENEGDTSFSQCQTQEKQGKKLLSTDSGVPSNFAICEKDAKQQEGSLSNKTVGSSLEGANISDANIDVNNSGGNSGIPSTSQNQTNKRQSNINSDNTRYSLGFETASGRKELLQQVKEERNCGGQIEEVQGSSVLLCSEARAAENDTSAYRLQTVPMPCSDSRDITMHLGSGSTDLLSRQCSPGLPAEAGTSDSIFQESFQKENSSLSLYSGHIPQSRPSKGQCWDAVVPDAMGIREDIDTNTSNLECKLMPSSAQAMPSVFATASGRSITVSAGHLRKAKNLLRDDESNPEKKEENEATLVPCAEKTSGSTRFLSCKTRKEVDGLAGKFMGFSTAAGKAVAVSEKALSHVQHFFEDPSHVDDHICKESTKTSKRANAMSSVEFQPIDVGSQISECQKEIRFDGFQTARGTAVNISKEAFDKARSLLESTEDNLQEEKRTSTEDQTSNQTLDRKSPFLGFETAGGSTVIVSETALKKAKNILKGDEINIGAKTLQEKPQTAPFPGFETAGGSKIKVSEAALMEVREIFTEDMSDSANNNGKGSSDSNISDKQKAASLMCFQTARGSKVTVSETALKEVNNLHNTQEEDDNRAGGNKEWPTKTSFGGFETARGSKVAISKAALQRVQHMNKTEEGQSTSNQKSQDKPSIFPGFETASGSRVNVSGDAVNQARELLKDKEPVRAYCRSEKHVKKQQIGDGDTHGDMLDKNKAQCGLLAERAVSQAAGYNRDELILELSESSTAFLTDGTTESFDEEIVFNHRKGLPKFATSTPAGTRGKTVGTEIHSEKGRYRPALSGRRLSTRPVSSTPEGFISDRCALRQSLSHHPLVSAPEKEVRDLEGQRRGVSFRWNGPTSYKTFSGEASSTEKNQQSNISVGTATPQKLNKSEPSFVTPYRKQNPNQGNFSTPVKTPTSQQATAIDSAPSGSFKTPVKTPSSTKRTVSEAEFTTPTNKKSKVDLSAQEHAKENVGMGKEQDLLVDWDDDPEDSLDSVLALAELEKMEASTRSDPGSKLQPQRIKVIDEVAKSRMKAKVEQAQRIRKKKEVGGVRPQPGCWYKERCAYKGLPLQTAVGGWTPRTYSKQQLHAFGVRESTLQVKAACAEDYRFWAGDFYGEKVTQESVTVRLGDGGLVIWDECSTAGKGEFCNALLDMEGVDPKLIDRDWVYNHYKWIVWKLAAMEAAFPQVFGGRKLTPDQVMLQLKYRYDREVDNSQRSAIKKIFERDDTPAKAMILCVSAIVSLPGQGANTRSLPKTHPSGDEDKDTTLPRETAVLELTDGWYPIKAVVDPALTRIVVAGRLQLGAKLCIYGAELIGSQEAAPPLQASADIMLKVSANSCRRARWDARLGFHRNPQPPPLPLCSLYRDGGQVCCVDVIVARVYPVQYMERTPGGGTVFRSARADQKVAGRYDDERQKEMEKIYTKLQAEFEKRAAGPDRRRSRRSGRHFTVSEIQSLSSGQDIDEAAQAASDPASVEDVLSSHQVALLTEYRRTQQEELHREMQAEFNAQVELLEEQKPKRNVVPLLKLRIAGCSTSDIDSKRDCMLTVWRPSDDVIETLSEGKRFKIYNLGAAEARGRMSRGGVSLTAQRSTRYQPVPVDTNFLDVIYEPREVSMLTELCPQFQPQYGEVDTVGVVVHVTPTSSFDRAGGDEGHVQTVYLADGERNLVAVTVWGSVAVFGLEEVLKPSSLVAFGNLQWRPNSRNQASHLPSLTLSEATLVSTNPKESHLRSALEYLKAKLKAVQAYVEEMREQLHGHITTPRHLDTTPQGGPQRNIVGRTPLSTPLFMQRRHPCTTQYPQAGAPAVSLGGQGDAPVPQAVQTGRINNQQQLQDNAAIGAENVAWGGEEEGRTEVTPCRTAPQRQALPAQQPDGGSSLAKTWTPIETPGSACGEVDVDPLVAKKRAIQRLKAKRLSMYADDTPVTPLNSSISAKARKAFKMPSSVSRSASPALQQNSGQKGLSTNKIKASIIQTDSSEEKLGRKLSFEEEGETKMTNNDKELDLETPVSRPELVLRTHSRSSLSLGGKAGDQQEPSTEKQCDTASASVKRDVSGTEQKIPPKSELHSKASTSSLKEHTASAKTDVCNIDNVLLPESDSQKSKRTRGRVKRLLSEGGEEGRPTKRPASLGPSRRKPKK